MEYVYLFKTEIFAKIHLFRVWLGFLPPFVQLFAFGDAPVAFLPPIGRPSVQPSWGTGRPAGAWPADGKANSKQSMAKKNSAQARLIRRVHQSYARNRWQFCLWKGLREPEWADNQASPKGRHSCSGSSRLPNPLEAWFRYSFCVFVQKYRFFQWFSFGSIWAYSFK